ncbi:MAG: sigma-70 family RNA polymerase sigma factor [bacterium]|nr:sigma-70 family RNA polymerase sigma factor [bacterium]
MTLKETIEELTPGVLRYCRGRTGCASLAEDLAQEALAALVSRWRRIGPPKNPAGFVYTIARRRCGRAELRRRILMPLGLIADAASPAPELEDRVDQRQQFAAAYRALMTLPRHDREVLLLIAVAELDQRNVADLLGVSVSAVKMRLHRARQRLTHAMEVADESA